MSAEPRTEPMAVVPAELPPDPEQDWGLSCELPELVTAGNAVQAWTEYCDEHGSWHEGGGTITWAGDEAGNPWLVPAAGTVKLVRHTALAIAVKPCRYFRAVVIPDEPGGIRLCVAEIVIALPGEGPPGTP